MPCNLTAAGGLGEGRWEEEEEEEDEVEEEGRSGDEHGCSVNKCGGGRVQRRLRKEGAFEKPSDAAHISNARNIA
jgi:hypothetical protein